uniref:Uncharacterized protein n=1 Tax=Pelusios castaneus TaxID=367368 RepID=A0A8C8S9R0_9SAUR
VFDLPTISNLQRDSSQVLCHSLSERDLEIANLKKEGEKLRRNQVLTTGLVTSLQRDISAKEQKIQQLTLNADKLKKENREKDNQLAVVSAKVDTHAYVFCYLLCYKCTKLFESIVLDRIMNFCGKKYKLTFSKPFFSSENGYVFHLLVYLFISSSAFVPFCQLMEKIRQIIDENLQIHKEEKLLQEEISSKDSEEKEVSENVEALKKSLNEFQAFLRTSYCSNGLKREICNLQDLCIDPSVLWIHTAVIGILSSLLSWVEAVEHLIQDTGIDISCSDKGSWFSFTYLMGDIFPIY